MSLLGEVRATPAPVLTSSSTAVGSPTMRSAWQRARFPLGLLLLVVLSALVVVATLGRGGQAALDPDAYVPQGSHALAQLLRDNGTRVTRVDNVPDAVRGAGPGTTVFAPTLFSLSHTELGLLANLPGELVVVSPTADELEALAVAVRVTGGVAVQKRSPACDLPAATKAGTVQLGGVTYQATGAAASIDCYDTGGSPTLVRLPGQRVTVLGSGSLFTNDKLGNQGNASLALGLVGSGAEVRWLVPSTNRQLLGAQRTRSLNSFVPDSLTFSLLQLGVAVLVLALWRARRLGRVVPEPLPIVVRAAEAVEGRSRLYRASRSSGSAGEQLRAGTRNTLGRWLGLSLDTSRESLVSNSAARTGRDPAALDALLYGAPPADDAALVRLADDLDNLTREVAGS